MTTHPLHPTPAASLPPAVSPWLLRWPQTLMPGARALDVACGSGRHVRWLAQAGLRVTGVDRDAAATAPLQPLAEIITADLEGGPWPLADRQFDLVLVTNYLWRPLLPRILAAVAPGGWLIYETFALGQHVIGRPSRAEFLLRPGELLQICQGLRVVGYEDGFEPGAELPPGDTKIAPPVNGRYVQRVAAVRAPPADDGVFLRYALPGR
ncbi:class I SAM-dependent methyltransferase [Roseateles koreensis]|uniref:Class I SAM-dependent methyltransferase n=1 Tax=Roseateles koreensis TaxID=2987526 RepID=A0ABT5KU56_9BURK|nr:class I SAM-dependent methyltransferase [Roseateles koreensis]MDC8785975.1 class I SAM-dependent methyltransferase [Roseateles koreensis]